LGFFRRFKTGKRMQNDKNAKNCSEAEKMPPAIIPEEAIILHTLEDAGILHHVLKSRHDALDFGQGASILKFLSQMWDTGLTNKFCIPQHARCKSFI
jgi:hypothetical protein